MTRPVHPLLSKDILILDGGLGTTLEDEHGIKFDKTTPLWSSHLLLTNPQLLEDVSVSFAKAGADILLTPTYQASYDGFCRTIIDGQAVDYYEEICQYLDLAIDITLEASKSCKISSESTGEHGSAASRGLVALSLGAYGATMSPSTEFSGAYPSDMTSETKLEHWHVERIAMYWASFDKVDLIAFETLPRIEEVRAIRVAANVNRHRNVYKPWWVTCVFPGDAERLPDESSVQDVVEALLGPKQWSDGVEILPPWGMGINCTEVGKLSKLINLFEAAANEKGYILPRLVIAPNGSKGQVYDTATQTWSDKKEDVESKQSWDLQVYDVIQEVRSRGKWQGVVVGGCCKTGPPEIRALRGRIDELGRQA